MSNGNIALWLNDLRSGSFKQAIGCLERIDVGCCPLGVACYTYQREVGGLTILPSKVDSRIREFDRSIFILPFKVANWLGITMTGKLKDGRSLAQLNDHDKMSFAEIADLVEEGTML